MLQYHSNSFLRLQWLGTLIDRPPKVQRKVASSLCRKGLFFAVRQGNVELLCKTLRRCRLSGSGGCADAETRGLRVDL